MSLEQLVENESKKEKKEQNEYKLKEWTWELNRLKEIYNSESVDLEDLNELVGSYGSRRVLIIDEELYLYRVNPERPLRKLIPIGNDEFYIEGLNTYKVSFIRNKRDEVERIRYRSTTRLLEFHKED